MCLTKPESTKKSKYFLYLKDKLSKIHEFATADLSKYQETKKER